MVQGYVAALLFLLGVMVGAALLLIFAVMAASGKGGAK
jgi:hypothetical protein